jgi:cytochrome d ubiquinol oxidase subunit II
VQFPFVVPGVATFRDAAAPDVTLKLLLLALAGGAVVLLPSLWYLFRTFNSADEGRGKRGGGGVARSPSD